MTRDQRNDHRERIVEEAAQWFTCMQDPTHSTEDRAAFESWLCASQTHVKEYLQTAALWDDCMDLGPDPDVESLIERFREDCGDESVIALFPEALSPSAKTTKQQGVGLARTRYKRFYIAVGTAASIILTVLIFSWFSQDKTLVYETAAAEHKEIFLADGSSVTLNARTKIEVSFNKGSRDLFIAKGEAFFDVAKDAHRPFRVKANKSVIQAVGTQFNVRRRQKNIAVTVVEGIVEIKPPSSASSEPLSDSAGALGAADTVRLMQGQRAKINIRTNEVALSDVNPKSALAWVDNRLVFESSPMSDVVEDFNLHNTVKLMIVDTDLEQSLISGSFEANNWQSFVKYLEASETIRVTVNTERRRVFIRQIE
jgi:transmembrane sensor